MNKITMENQLRSIFIPATPTWEVDQSLVTRQEQIGPRVNDEREEKPIENNLIKQKY
jgi:hypothetical protein